MRLACHFIVLALVCAIFYFCTVPYVQVAQPQPEPLVPPRVEIPSVPSYHAFTPDLVLPPARASPQSTVPDTPRLPEPTRRI